MILVQVGMTTDNRSVQLVPLIVSMAILLSACAAPGGTTPSSGQTSQSGERAAQSEAQRRPKIVTLAVLREPTSFVQDFTGGNSTAGGAIHIPHLAHDQLVIMNDKGIWQPLLAAGQISIENGSWRLNPDGTMETIWKIRPNVRWHDGAPFTSEDLLFSFTVYKDPELPNMFGNVLRVMDSATAPDPHTFVIHWSDVFVRANEAQALIPLPKHLLEETYRTDKGNLQNSPRLTTEWVGLGPYRLQRWDRATEMELTRFDQYYQGRPLLDSVIVKFVGDPNTMVASALAGAIDVVLSPGVSTNTALEVRERWRGTRNQVRADLNGRIRYLEIQHRPEFAQPSNGLTERTVRQALYHGLDLQTISDVITEGFGTPADSWIAPGTELRPQLESSIPKFPYDLARAQQLLAQAGWARGGDGVLTHQGTSQRFDLELWSTQGGNVERQLGAVADGWKAVGVQASFNIIPSALGADREYRSKLPGVGISGVGAEEFVTERLHSKQATSPTNRWNGANRGGYSNPQVDSILDQLVKTISPAERLPLHRELLQAQMGDVAFMPLYWDIDPILVSNGVKNVGLNADSRNTWNIFEWDKE